MTPQNRHLHSTDPLDQQIDPLDQPSAIAGMELHASIPLDVRRLRVRMRLTQREFAGWFGFPVATLRHWERGNRRPRGTALVLLHVIRENPRVVLQAVKKIRRESAGQLAPIERLRSYRAPPGYGQRRRR